MISKKSARIVFGKEPKDYEVYEYIRRNYYNLRFSAEVMIDKAEHIKINPKRMQRDIRRQMQKKTVGTKSQNAIKLLREEMQEERKTRKKLKKEEGITLYRMIKVASSFFT